jgi:hypothetical protein
MCGLQMNTRPRTWYIERYPKCNRVAGHEGPHREYDRRTFHIKAEWTDAEVRQQKGKHAPA